MKPEKKLDRVLHGKSTPDASTAALVAAAGELKPLAATTAPMPGHVRTMFVSAVQGRRPRIVAPLLASVAAGTALVFALGFMAMNALPGDSIYVVRKVMASVGLVSSPAERTVALLDAADARLTIAEQLVEGSPGRARGLAFEAIAKIVAARRLLADLSPQMRNRLEAEIESLSGRAVAVITFSMGHEERVRGGAEEEPQGDNEGPGGDDNEGPEGDDNEEPEGDDDEGGDDDGLKDDGGDDNSGPGGDGNDSTEGSSDRDSDTDFDSDSGDFGDNDNSGPGSADDSDTGDSSLED